MTSNKLSDFSGDPHHDANRGSLPLRERNDVGLGNVADNSHGCRRIPTNCSRCAGMSH